MYSKVCYNEDILENVLKSPEGLCAIVIFSVQENAKISIKHGLKWLMVAWRTCVSTLIRLWLHCAGDWARCIMSILA
jgi:hypothetical protein